MSGIDTLFTRAKLSDGSLNDIGVAAGRILSVSPFGSSAEAGSVVDLGGALLVPGFVEGHIHLDTSFYGGASSYPRNHGADHRRRRI